MRNLFSRSVLLWYSPNSFSLRQNKKTEDIFIDPDCEDKVDYGIGLSYRPVGLRRLRSVTITLCFSRPYPPVRDYESGYSFYVISSTF
jgi:hypothetical protein